MVAVSKKYVKKEEAYLMQKLGHQTFIYDPYKGYNEIRRDVDITFICTPENNIEEAIQTLTAEKVQRLLVIKSTTPIGITKALMKEYKHHICHNPEFLREKHALEDVVNPDRIIIGKCCNSHATLLKVLYESLNKPIFITDPITNEVSKLVSNAYLSMLITFWNEVNELAQKLGLKTNEIAEIICADHRMSRYGTSKFGEPFKGSCLPKDLDHLINAFLRVQFNSPFFTAIRECNKNWGL